MCLHIDIENVFLRIAVEHMASVLSIQKGSQIEIEKQNGYKRLIITDKVFCLPGLASETNKKNYYPDVYYVYIHDGDLPYYFNSCGYLLHGLSLGSPIAKFERIFSELERLLRYGRQGAFMSSCFGCQKKDLTKVETDFITLLGIGCKMEDIAGLIGCQPKSVYNYKKAVKKKLGIEKDLYFNKFISFKVIL